jgi:secreted PhoX family phosphatase
MTAGPLHALGFRTSHGSAFKRSNGYGPLVLKGDLWLPQEFNYHVVARQGQLMSDGKPRPGIFDGMAAYRGPKGTTILILNHENRERPGEIKVITGPAYEYDQAMFGGNTKLRVRRQRDGRHPDGSPRYTYSVVESFAILGGTSTNCAGGVMDRSWVTCEEVVKGPRGTGASFAPKKHGYNFEIRADATGPVKAEPIIAAGRFSHEAVVWSAGILYQTEDRGITPDLRTDKKLIGSVFYRYIPERFRDDDDDDDRRSRRDRDDDDRRDRDDDDSDDGRRRRRGRLANTKGKLQALKLRNEFHANMDVGRVVGRPYRVEWIDVPEPDHDDDTDDRRDRVRGFTPTRIQAQDRGAAFFDRQEGAWLEEGYDDDEDRRVYFDCTTGGALDLGQVWEYDPGHETITLIYESSDPARLQNPDNVVVVPQTGDIFLQEDGDGEQYVRGLTRDGSIYDFAKTATNDTEFCGGCFDPDGHTLYLNQQGERGGLPDGPPDGQAVMYAIYGPFGNRRRDDVDDED